MSKRTYATETQEGTFVAEGGLIGNNGVWVIPHAQDARDAASLLHNAVARHKEAHYNRLRRVGPTLEQDLMVRIESPTPQIPVSHLDSVYFLEGLKLPEWFYEEAYNEIYG